MIEIKEFKGHKILVITDDVKKYKRLSIGIFKANLILNNIEVIRTFVINNTK